MPFGKPIRFHQYLFAPDLGTDTAGVITDATSMYPTMSGCRVMPSAVAVALALPDTPLGAFVSISSDGAVNVFAGTAQHLYRLVYGLVIPGSETTYDQFCTKYGQYENLPMLTYGDPSFGPPAPTIIQGGSWVEVDGGQIFDADEWTFAQSGDDVIAVDGVDPDQIFPGGGTQFAPMIGAVGAGGGAINPPVAAYVTSVDPGAGVSQVVILANLASDPTAWAASGPGNDLLWSLDERDLSASDSLGGSPGAVTGAKTVRGLGVLFKRNAIYAGAFVGPPYVWDWYPISFQVGCQSNKAIIDIGDLLAFPGPDDFYTFDGTSLNPIPGALREWFFGVPGESGNGIADPLYMNKIQAQYDEATAVVYWRFASVNANPPGTLDSCIAWNKKSGRWIPGHLYMGLGPLSNFGKSALTYDQFCDRYQQYQDLPHLTYGDVSFGPSPIRTQAFFGPDNILYALSGPPNSGSYQSGDIGDPIRLTRINRMRAQFGVFPAPGATGQRALLSTFVRRNLGEALTPFKTGVPLSNQGYFDFIETAGWHQYLMQFQSDAEPQAVTIDLNDAGDR